MDYHIKASSISNEDAIIHIKQSNIDLFLGEFAFFIPKNALFSGDLNTIKDV